MTERVETGRLQIGNDWPGTFIRGDESIGYAQALRALLAMAEERAKAGQMDSVEALYWARVRALIGVLNECRVENGGRARWLSRAGT